MRAIVFVIFGLIIVVILCTAGMCNSKPPANDEVNTPVVSPDKPGDQGTVTPPDGAVEQPETPETPEGGTDVKLPEIVEPMNEAKVSEIAGIWPKELPDYLTKEGWSLAKCYVSPDGKHAKKVFMTPDKARDIFDLHDKKLGVIGWDMRQITDDARYFGRNDYTNGEILVCVGVILDKQTNMNRVEVSVHRK